jgi:hypothetical protein
VAEARKDLFRAGILVARNGSQTLSSLKLPCGPLTYKKLEKGFELATTRKYHDQHLRLVFGCGAGESRK